MLINDIETVQEIVKITRSIDFDQLKTSIQQAEELFIIPAIGQEQYDALNSAAGPVSPDLDGPKTKLLRKIEVSLSWFAVMLWLPEGMIKVTADGPIVVTSENTKTPWQWQIDKVEIKYLNAGFRALENLYAFLEANKADYPLWTSSTAYTESRENFIPNATIFNKYYHIDNSRRMYVRLKPYMLKLEDFYIKPLLGEEYYDELKAVISTVDPSDDDQVVVNYVRKIMAPLSIHRALEEGMLDVGPDGVFINLFDSGTNKKQAPADRRIQNVADRALADAEIYIQQLKTFLNKNASSILYETYFESSTYTDPATDTKFPNSKDNSFYVAR